jgi:hypothetical protein
LAYADDINTMGKNADTKQKNTKAQSVANKEADLQVNKGKTKYMLTSHYQNTGQKHSVKIANRSFKDVAKFKYLGTTLIDKNCMH